jgi:hypothetical protein
LNSDEDIACTIVFWPFMFITGIVVNVWCPIWQLILKTIKKLAKLE